MNRLDFLFTNKSLKIAEVRGIPILIHWTFGFFIAFILFSAWSTQSNLHDAFWFVAFVLLLFLFVILHELGHAMAALRYGIHTKDIILSPIGGVARLYSIPKNPTHEIIVAISGPLVNVALALFFLVLLLPFSTSLFPENLHTMNLINNPKDYLRFLFTINLTLVLFNMIPAFPMDGGRVFRAALSYKLSRRKATYIAMIIARILALGFIVFGFYNGLPMWALIGGFVLITSGSEYKNVKNDHNLSNTPIVKALIENPTILNLNTVWSDIKSLKRNDQNHYPVKSSAHRIIGSLTDPAIRIAQKDKALNSDSIINYVTNSHGALSSTLRLKSAFSMMEKNNWYTASVYNAYHEEVGILDRKSLKNCLRKGQTA